MAHHHDWVTDSFGNAKAATVTVYLAGSSTLATLYSDAALTVSLSNPVTADDAGFYEFYVNPGAYKLSYAHASFGTEEVDYVTIGSPLVDVKDFGARGDGTTDDTSAIAAAIAAAEAGRKTLYFPTGSYLLNGSGSTIFTITKPLTVRGDGPSSLLLLSSSVPNSRDVFTYSPASVNDGYFPTFRDFRIGGQSSGVGRYGIHFKPTVSGRKVVRALVDRVWFGSLSSFAIYADNSTAAVWQTTIRGCHVDGNGIGGVELYDSLLIQDCILGGTGYGVDITSFTSLGPGRFSLENSTVTSSSGVRIGGPITSLSLVGNFFETVNTFDGANGAYVNLAGASGSVIAAPRIVGNVFNVQSGDGDPDGLRLDFVDDAFIDQNVFTGVSGADAIALTSNCNRAHISSSNTFGGFGNRWVNSASMSSGSSKALMNLLADGTAIASTTDESAHSKSITIPANYLKAGQILRIWAAGHFSCTGTPTLVNRIKLNLTSVGPPVSGGTAVAVEGFACGSGVSTFAWRLESILVVRSVGASGSLSRSHQTSNNISMSNITVDTTAAITAHVTSAWSASSASNTVTLTQLFAEIVNPVASI